MRQYDNLSLEKVCITMSNEGDLDSPSIHDYKQIRNGLALSVEGLTPLRCLSNSDSEEERARSSGLEPKQIVTPPPPAAPVA